VAINSIPQHDVAKGKGHKEFARASPTALSRVVAKKPAPETPGGAGANFISLIIHGIKCQLVMALILKNNLHFKGRYALKFNNLALRNYNYWLFRTVLQKIKEAVNPTLMPVF
jgi:hypothetical protein